MKLIHYSRSGYNGNYTYTSVCGKKVKTHQHNEESSIDPAKANCPQCLATKEHLVDFTDLKITKRGIKRRIYIESDILKASEFKSAQDDVFDFAKKNNLKFVDRGFSEVLDFAWHNLEKTWEAVKRADEIYATTSLMPLTGNSYTGAPVIFDAMCKKAVAENVTGKSVVILNLLKNIYWDMIDIEVMKAAFKKNVLYMYDKKYDLCKVDISSIKNK